MGLFFYSVFDLYGYILKRFSEEEKIRSTDWKWINKIKINEVLFRTSSLQIKTLHHKMHASFTLEEYEFF